MWLPRVRTRARWAPLGRGPSSTSFPRRGERSVSTERVSRGQRFLEKIYIPPLVSRSEWGEGGGHTMLFRCFAAPVMEKSSIFGDRAAVSRSSSMTSKVTGTTMMVRGWRVKIKIEKKLSELQLLPFRTIGYFRAKNFNGWYGIWWDHLKGAMYRLLCIRCTLNERSGTLFSFFFFFYKNEIKVWKSVCRLHFTRFGKCRRRVLVFHRMILSQHPFPRVLIITNAKITSVKNLP